MLLATKAWALHCQHGEAVAERVDYLFRESRELKDRNAWACNWYGLFLYNVKSDSIRAEAEFRKAIGINSKVPPFYRNLARLLQETMTVFSRDRNREVITNCKLAMGLCPPGSYWNWGKMPEEIESMLYVAESLDQQRVRDGVGLAI
jgi:hypothetical protein